MSKYRVIVALDMPLKQALQLARKLPKGATVKVSAALWSQDHGIIEALGKMGLYVMLDLKTHDIPFQVGETVKNYLHPAISLFTVHASGGSSMIRAALDARDAWVKTNGIDPMNRPEALAVTVLTSLKQEDLRRQGIEGTPADHVKRLARVSMLGGLDNFVCSPQETAIVRELAGPYGLIVNPGIRMTEGDVEGDDQKRVGTPQGAIRAGASFVVVGRPITQADNPSAAYRLHDDDAVEGVS